MEKQQCGDMILDLIQTTVRMKVVTKTTSQSKIEPVIKDVVDSPIIARTTFENPEHTNFDTGEFLLPGPLFNTTGGITLVSTLLFAISHCYFPFIIQFYCDNYFVPYQIGG